jgi:hypothetical protein
MIPKSAQRFSEKIMRNNWQERVSNVDSSIPIEVIFSKPIVT